MNRIGSPPPKPPVPAAVAEPDPAARPNQPTRAEPPPAATAKPAAPAQSFRTSAPPAHALVAPPVATPLPNLELGEPPTSWTEQVSAALLQTGAGVARAAAEGARSAGAAIDRASQTLVVAGRRLEASGHALVSAAENLVASAATASFAALEQWVADTADVLCDVGATAAAAGIAGVHASVAANTGDAGQLDLAGAAIAEAEARARSAEGNVVLAGARVPVSSATPGAVESALEAVREAYAQTLSSLDAAGAATSELVAAIAATPGRIMERLSGALAEGGHETRAALSRSLPGAARIFASLELADRGSDEVLHGLATASPLEVAQGLRDGLRARVDFAAGLLETPAAAPLAEAAERGFALAKAGFESAKRTLGEYADGFSPDIQLEKLRPGSGDSYAIMVGAKVAVALGVEGVAGLGVRACTDGSYVISAHALAGPDFDFSPVKVARLQVSAAARLMLGGHAEFRCSDKNEAARVIAVLSRAASALSWAASVPVIGPLELAARMPAPEDLEFLRLKAISVEARGELAAALRTEFKLPVLSKVLASELRISGGADSALRVELRAGLPVALVDRAFLHGEAVLGSGLRVSGRAGTEGGGSDSILWKVRDTRQALRVVLGHHYPLPANVSLEDLLAQPQASLRRVREHMIRHEQTTVAVSLTGEAGLIGLPSGGYTADATFSEAGHALPSLEALRLVLTGDLAAASRVAGVQCDGTLRTWTRRTWGFDRTSLMLAGVGLEGTFYAARSTETPVASINPPAEPGLRPQDDLMLVPPP